MDIQEAMESLQKQVEGAIAPSIRDIQVRLDRLGHDMQNIRENTQGIREGIREGNTRYERLEMLMNNGLADLRGEIRDLHTRFDALMTACLIDGCGLQSSHGPVYPVER